MADVVIRIITGWIGAKGEDQTAESPGDFFIGRDIPVYYQQPVFRQQLCKRTEGGTDIVQIPEEIHMVFFYIKYNADSGEKA